MSFLLKKLTLLIFVLIFSISIFYGILVFDIAREYFFDFKSIPIDNDIVHKGNIWETFFSWATTEELAIINGIQIQRIFYLKSRLFMVSHWVGGGLIMFISPLQFIPYIRNNYIIIHKISGYSYFFGAILSLIGSFGFFYDNNWQTELYNGHIFSIPLFLLGGLSTVANINAYRYIKKKRIRNHVVWILLSYGTFLTAPWLRLLWVVIPPVFRLFGATYEDSNNMEIINLMSEIWVLTPIVLACFVVLSVFNKDIKYTNTKRMKEKKITNNKLIRLLIKSMIIIVILWYQFYFRFKYNNNFIYKDVIERFSTFNTTEFEREFRESRLTYFDRSSYIDSTMITSSFQSIMTNIMPKQYDQELYTIVLLVSLSIVMILNPILMKKIFDEKRIGQFIIFFYTITMVTLSSCFFILHSLVNGNSFGGSIFNSVLISTFVLIFISICFFHHYATSPVSTPTSNNKTEKNSNNNDHTLLSKVWISILHALINESLFNYLIILIVSSIFITYSFYESYLLSANLAFALSLSRVYVSFSKFNV